MYIRLQVAICESRYQYIKCLVMERNISSIAQAYNSEIITSNSNIFTIIMFLTTKQLTFKFLVTSRNRTIEVINIQKRIKIDNIKVFFSL